MEINDSVFDGRSDIAGPTTRRPRPPPPQSKPESHPKKKRGRRPKKRAPETEDSLSAASKESSRDNPGARGSASRGRPPFSMPPPSPSQPPLNSTSSPGPPRKLPVSSGPMPSLPYSSPVPPPADGTPPVVMVTTVARQADSIARKEYLSRQVDRAAEEIRRQLQLDKDRVTGSRTTSKIASGSERQESGGRGGRPATSSPSHVERSQPSAERIVSSYVPTRQTMADFERLDVLVCGSCKSVFHNIDEFKSHSSTCSKRSGTTASGVEIFEDVEDVSSEAAVAMVIWCNTVRRVLVQAGVQFDDAADLGRLIQSKWYRLSHRARSTWLRAAKSLVSLGQKGRIVFGGRANFSNLIEEVMPLTGAECRPDVSHIKRELEESWVDLGINANVSGAGRPLPKIPIPISQETIEVIRTAAATAATALENPREKAAATKARAAQTISVATKSQSTITKETPKKMRSAFCQTAAPKTHREKSIAIQTDVSMDKVLEAEESEQLPILNECSCQQKREVVEVLANRGNEYYVVYKDRADPVWEKESAIDEALIQTFKERTNPHLAKSGADFSASATDNDEGPLPESSVFVELDENVTQSSRSAATNLSISNKSHSRRKSGAPTKVTKEDTPPENRTRRRKPEKPSKVSDAADEESPTISGPKKIMNEEGDLDEHGKYEVGRETLNVEDGVSEEDASGKESKLVEDPEKEVIKSTRIRKRSKTSADMHPSVSPRSRRKSSAQALTKFRKWGAAEEEDDDDDDARVRKSERHGTASTTDVDKVVSEFQAELDLDMSQVDDSGLLASHGGHCDPEYVAREQTKREREEARKSRLIDKKLKLAEEKEEEEKKEEEKKEEDVTVEMSAAEVAPNEVVETDDEPGPSASPRRSQRATTGKKSNLTSDDKSDITFNRENRDEDQDKDKDQCKDQYQEADKAEEDNNKEKDGSGNVQDGVITIGGEGQPATLVQAANQQLGVVPKRKRGRPPKYRDAQGNPIPAKALKLSSPKKKRGRPKRVVSEDEDYVPKIPSNNVNMLNDLFRTSDEDTVDEEQDLKKLSSGLTIRPVESTDENKTKRKGQSLKTILAGRKSSWLPAPGSSRRRSARKRKRRIGYGDDEESETVDDDDTGMDEDDFSFPDDTDDHDDDFAGGRKRKREVVPANLAKLVPEGFRMVRHLNEKGIVEYRVKKAGHGQAVVARKSAPKEKEPRLVEFGARRSSGARVDSEDNVIFVGHAPGQGSGGQGSGGAVGARRASDCGSGLSASEGNGNGGPFVKLTYKPSEEELEVSRKQQESLVAHRKQVQSTSSSGTHRVAIVTTANGGTTSTTTLATAPSATRVSPLSHEVTSTTEGDEEVTFAAETISNAVAEYSLDPTSGVLVDKDGNPLQAPLANIGSDVSNAEMVMLPTSVSTATLHSASAVEQQVVVNLPQTTSNDIQVSFPNMTAAATSVDRSTLVVAPQSVHQPGVAEAQMLFTNAASATQPTLKTLHQHQLQTTPTLTLDPSTSFTTGTLQLADDVSLSIPASAQAGTTHLATAAGIAPGGGSDGTSNKVLLVLPGGQMILTDLTDEQCGQLNIQVGSQGQQQQPQQQPPTLEQQEVMALPSDGPVFQSASESEGAQSGMLDDESKEEDREGEIVGQPQGPPTLIHPLPPDDNSSQKND